MKFPYLGHMYPHYRTKKITWSQIIRAYITSNDFCDNNVWDWQIALKALSF